MSSAKERAAFRGKRSSVVPARERGRRPAPLPRVLDLLSSIRAKREPSKVAAGSKRRRCETSSGAAAPAKRRRDGIAADAAARAGRRSGRPEPSKPRAARRASRPAGEPATWSARGGLPPLATGGTDGVHHSAARRRSCSTRPSGSGRMRKSALTISRVSVASRSSSPARTARRACAAGRDGTVHRNRVEQGDSSGRHADREGPPPVQGEHDFGFVQVRGDADRHKETSSAPRRSNPERAIRPRSARQTATSAFAAGAAARAHKAAAETAQRQRAIVFTGKVSGSYTRRQGCCGGVSYRALGVPSGFRGVGPQM